MDNRKLESYELTHENYNEFVGIFNLKPLTAIKLSDWLRDNDKVVKINECYDPQSGWHGRSFMIGNADLSYNGYCLNDNSVMLFISGGHDNRWYNVSDPEFKSK